MTAPRPRCPQCNQPLPATPALCTCGHPDSSHHRTDTGRLTWCPRGEHGRQCRCPGYAEATPAGYGPLPLATSETA